MTTLTRIWDTGLGRFRNHYAWELPSFMRPTPGQSRRDRRRAARDRARARDRSTRQQASGRIGPCIRTDDGNQR